MTVISNICKAKTSHRTMSVFWMWCALTRHGTRLWRSTNTFNHITGVCHVKVTLSVPSLQWQLRNWESHRHGVSSGRCKCLALVKLWWHSLLPKTTASIGKEWRLLFWVVCLAMQWFAVVASHLLAHVVRCGVLAWDHFQSYQYGGDFPNFRSQQ